ncbi:MAG: rhomboid family intramembrane serine protease [Bacteroidia bacterium]|nr:rhomboid family intramembrane serine protease [Bacteroidia bacterium]MCF8427753.1 rhomboid family intramembrane serine protease [Bacteroidia bacterium]MCF8447826.1 rhomboid family intramembrane serine protease [Bacteroidia bacterium]
MFSDLTLVIIVITAIISIQAFSQTQVMNNLIFNPFVIKQRNQWYRFVTSGFLHGDWLHLIINMFVLYSFGNVVQHYYKYFFGSAGNWMYLLLYLSGIFAANATTYYKQQNNPAYNALGASGAVSAVVFASILFQPTAKIYLYGIIGIPGYIAGILYLVYSQYAAQKGRDNINHDAHFYGAIYGIVFTLVFKPAVFKFFLNQF